MERYIELYEWVEFYLEDDTIYKQIDIKDAYLDLVTFGRLIMKQHTETKQWTQLVQRFEKWKMENEQK